MNMHTRTTDRLPKIEFNGFDNYEGGTVTCAMYDKRNI